MFDRLGTLQAMFPAIKEDLQACNVAPNAENMLLAAIFIELVQIRLLVGKPMFAVTQAGSLLSELEGKIPDLTPAPVGDMRGDDDGRGALDETKVNE